ncbi:hypothetical protein DASC09_040420 [Saccharomycopsis crataegensis]|uniref:Nucleoporin Nup159/Nup146 N-terminal domain-containing protein n=1 Tax=Saccharomycopsis crataegensis TaxID=43959 RepID=A0AAV5QPG7_9ASCO|nr:hypothetical protein DASC09_040420 [Saccharomycopsis crataegensis]
MAGVEPVDNETVGFQQSHILKLLFPQTSLDEAVSHQASSLFDINNFNQLFVASKGEHIIIDKVSRLHQLIEYSNSGSDDDGDEDESVTELSPKHMITLNANLKFVKLLTNKLIIAAEDLVIIKTIKDPNDLNDITDLSSNMSMVKIDDAEEIVDLKIQESEDYAIIVGSNHTLFSIDLNSESPEATLLKFKHKVLSVEFSTISSDVIYIGFDDFDKSHIVKYNFKTRKAIQKIEKDIDIPGSLEPISLLELNEYELLVSYDLSGKAKDGDRFQDMALSSPRYTSYVINFKDVSNVTTSQVDEELCFNLDDAERDFMNYSVRLRDWEICGKKDDLFLITTSVASYISIFKHDQIVVPKDDALKASMPMDPVEFDDLSVCGLALDLVSSNTPITIPNVEDPVLGKTMSLWLFATNGMLAKYDFFDVDAIKSGKQFTNIDYQLKLLKDSRMIQESGSRIDAPVVSSALTKGSLLSPADEKNVAPSAFGSANTGGLFGKSTDNGIANNSGSLFGKSTDNGIANNSGSLFGKSADNGIANNSGSLFGNNSGGLFVKSTDNGIANNSGSLFGNNTGGLFGKSTDNGISNDGGSLFGNNTGGLFGKSTDNGISNDGGSLFGGNTFGKSDVLLLGNKVENPFGSKSNNTSSIFTDAAFKSGKNGSNALGFGAAGFGSKANDHNQSSGFGKAGFSFGNATEDKNKKVESLGFGTAGFGSKANDQNQSSGFGKAGFSFGNAALIDPSKPTAPRFFPGKFNTNKESSHGTRIEDKVLSVPSAESAPIDQPTLPSNESGEEKPKIELSEVQSENLKPKTNPVTEDNENKVDAETVLSNSEGESEPDNIVKDEDAANLIENITINNETSSNHEDTKVISTGTSERDMNNADTKSAEEPNNDTTKVISDTREALQITDSGNSKTKKTEKPKKGLLSSAYADTDNEEEEEGEEEKEKEEESEKNEEEKKENEGKENQDLVEVEKEFEKVDLGNTDKMVGFDEDKGKNRVDKEIVVQKNYVVASVETMKPEVVDKEVDCTKKFVETFIDAPVKDYKNSNILSFESDEEYLNQFKISKSAPTQYELDKIKYPDSMNKKSEINRQLHKLYYDSVAEYQIILKNEESLNDFVKDHLMIKHDAKSRFTSLKNIYTWRLSEVPIITDMIDTKHAREAGDLYNKMDGLHQQVKNFKSGAFNEFRCKYDKFVKEYEIVEVNTKLLNPKNNNEVGENKRPNIIEKRTLPLEFSLIQQRVKTKFNKIIKLFSELESKILILKSKYETLFNKNLSPKAKVAMFLKFQTIIHKIESSIKQQMQEVAVLLKDVGTIKLYQEQDMGPQDAASASTSSLSLASGGSSKSRAMAVGNAISEYDENQKSMSQKLNMNNLNSAMSKKEELFSSFNQCSPESFTVSYQL